MKRKLRSLADSTIFAESDSNNGIIALICVLLFLMLMSTRSSAQTTCTIDNTTVYGAAPALANGAAYKNFNDAITQLNAAGSLSLPATFNVTAGQTFNETSLIPGITKSGTSSANSITFQKNGAGSDPLINPTAGTGAADAVITISGGDY